MFRPPADFASSGTEDLAGRGACGREDEVLDALGAGRDLLDSDDELRGHVAACRGCADLAAVAGAVLDDRRALMREAQIAGAGLAWWRVTMRARQQEVRAAIRTARMVQVVLVVTALVVAFALIGRKITSLQLPTVLSSIQSAIVGFGLPLLALGAWLILAPLAVYLVVSEE